MTFKFPTFLVGGAVRDKLMGLNSKDLDYVVLAPSFEAMEAMIVEAGGKIFQSRPEFLVSRANHPELGAVDFAVARGDGEYTNGRHPDSTFIAKSIEEDLSRRDFTMNAVAENVETGEIVDPFNGAGDIRRKLICSVRSPEKRLAEDKLRAFRAIRFAVTKGFEMDFNLGVAINALTVEDFKSVSTERIKDEIGKMFKADVFAAIAWLEEFPNLKEIAFKDRGLWLEPTSKKK